MKTNNSRDDLLSEAGKETLKDRYLMKNETYQGMFALVAKAYGINPEHAQRIYNYISQHWFMPSTPILSNGGNERGLPISCFLSEATDKMDGIVETWNENTWLSVKGGGIGSYWGNIRSIGERIGQVGKSSGVVPFLKVQDSLTLAISQGSLRRGSSAIYMPVWHPEIEEFIEIRRPTGGDPNRKCLNLHHGVVLDEEFMQAVEKGEEYALRSPKDMAVVERVSARDIWRRILTARMETGEPYIMFKDNVNKYTPSHHKYLGGMDAKMSNLCSEILLPTGKDYLGKERTAVCCLSSLNLNYFYQWRHEPDFIKDVMEFLDNVLEDFIQKAPDSHAKAKYSAMRERSVGLGVMGLHDLYQSKGLAWGSPEAYELNKIVFSHIKEHADEANLSLGQERGPCPDAFDAGELKRFSYTMAIAPTASISVLCGEASPGIEPCFSNIYTHKTLSGTFVIKNKNLEKLLKSLDKDNQETWSNIVANEGSVQQLDCLTPEQKEVFKTAFEIEQMHLIRQAAARSPFIDQGQSLNLFIRPEAQKRYVSNLHMTAWRLGVKTLYYCRSEAASEATAIGKKVEREVIQEESSCKDGVCELVLPTPKKYEECEACQ